MVVWNFIKSLFMPREMARHRFMPVLVAICLFVCSSYLLLLPARYYYLHNTTKLVDKNNLFYMQSIRDLDRYGVNSPDILDFKEEFINKNITTENGKVKANHLGLYSIELSDDFIGYIEKNGENYYFNGSDTTIVISDKTKDYPTITSLNDKFIIDGVNDKEINAPGLTEGEEVNVVKISLVSSNSHLEIDGLDSGINISSDKATLSVSDNKLVVNGITTNKDISGHTIIYFAPRATSYYERDIMYVNDSGVNTHIKFVVDLSKQSISSSPYTVDVEGYDYLNEDYFFVVVSEETVYYQAHLAGINDKNVERNGKTLQCQGFNTFVSKLPFTFEALLSDNFGDYLYHYITDGYASISISNFSLVSLIYLVGFTLIISLLFLFLFRKAGRMKKFKEYYNIASIANIVPVLITFVVMWFNPAWFGTVYLVSFAIYYLFVLYRINNSPAQI